MKDLNIIYWSSTGNTEAMANLVAEGAKEKGVNPIVTEVSKASSEELKDQICFALGAPAMGAEEIDGEMEDFVVQVEAFAAGKTIGLFGSHDWGDGTWMKDWVSRMEKAGAVVLGGEEAIANLEPDDEAAADCKALGQHLAEILE